MKMLRIVTVLAAVLLLWGCNSIDIKKLDPGNPAGIPFYMTKPMLETTTTEYVFRKLDSGDKLFEYRSEETKIVNVIDKEAAYTINHTRAFAGESTFKLGRSIVTNGISGSDLSSIEVINKEGITEFLKGLFEGTKQLTEAAKELAKEGAGAAGAGVDSNEASIFEKLLAAGIIVTKHIISVTYTDL